VGEESCRHWHMPVFSEVRWRVRTHERRAAAARVPRPRESSRGIVTRGMQRGPRAQAIANRREHRAPPSPSHTLINTPTTASLARSDRQNSITALALPLSLSFSHSFSFSLNVGGGAETHPRHEHRHTVTVLWCHSTTPQPTPSSSD